MGIAASSGRMMMLTARKMDLEFQIQIINQRRMTLSKRAGELAKGYADTMYQTADPSVLGGSNALLGSATWDPSGVSVAQSGVATGRYEAEMATVEALDKQLELRQTELNTQHKAAETEVDAVQKVIDKSIEKGFKTLG